MILAVIYRNEKEVDRGIKTGGKHYVEHAPQQDVTIADETSAFHVNGERTYHHDEEITFKEFQDNGEGWECVYDSEEGVDRTVNYGVPSWFSNPSMGIPNYHHRLDEDGEIENEFRGYVK